MDNLPLACPRCKAWQGIDTLGLFGGYRSRILGEWWVCLIWNEGLEFSASKLVQVLTIFTEKQIIDEVSGTVYAYDVLWPKLISEWSGRRPYPLRCENHKDQPESLDLRTPTWGDCSNWTPMCLIKEGIFDKWYIYTYKHNIWLLGPLGWWITSEMP